MPDAVLTKPAEGEALNSLLLHHSVQAFLFAEAEALDRCEFERWLDFFAEDCRYWVPLRRNVESRGQRSSVGGPGEVAWIDDDKAMLRMRVAQIRTGLHWAEEPFSRVAHVVANVRIVDEGKDEPGGEIQVNSRVITHRTRMETETDLLVGLREDKLRRRGGAFEIVTRKVILNHHTLTAKNLSFFV